MDPNNPYELPVPEPVKKPMNFYKHLRITSHKAEAIPRAVVKMHGIPICTRKNLTLLSGASKSGKTAITSVLCAGGMQVNGMDGSDSIEIEENDEMAVIHIDTEQSRYHHQRNLSSILKRAGLAVEPDYYYSYNIRELSLLEYKLFLESLFEMAEELHGGIHLAVIDGIADFIPSVNDEIESNSIVSFFEKLAIKHDVPIVLVLHVNPGTEKERGHLGSQLQRKCESVLGIEKNESDISILKAKFLRNGASGKFSPIQYYFDDFKGYHVFMGATQIETKTTALAELARQVFVHAITYSQAVMKVEETDRCATRTAKRKVKEMCEAGFVEKQELGNSVYYQLKQTQNGHETPF